MHKTATISASRSTTAFVAGVITTTVFLLLAPVVVTVTTDSFVSLEAASASAQRKIVTPCVGCVPETGSFLGGLGWVASSVFSFATNAVGTFANFILYLIWKFLGALTWLVATVFAFMVWIAIQPLSTFPIVEIGWKITRDIVNLALLLIWTVMAIGTILRSSKFNARAMLPALLIIAVLINFSLLIAGFLIDITNFFAVDFLTQAAGGIDLTDDTQFWSWAGGFVGTLMNGINASDIIQPVTKEDFENSETEKQDVDSIANIFIGLLFNIILLLGVIFTLSALEFMLIIRQLALIFLVILMPLAWGAYILPNTRGQWSKWWSQFNRWIIFFPAFTFFLYLAVRFSSTLQQSGFGSGITTIAQQPELRAQVEAITDGGAIAAAAFIDPQRLIGYITVLGFLLGSVIVSNSIGVIGSKYVQQIVYGGYRRAGQFTKSGGRRIRQTTGGPRRMQQLAETRVGRLFTGLAPGVYAEQQAKKRGKATKKRLGGKSEKMYVQENFPQMVQFLRQRAYSPTDVDAQTQLLVESVKQGKMGDLVDEKKGIGIQRAQKLIARAKAQGLSPDVLTNAKQQSNRLAFAMGDREKEIRENNERQFDKEPRKALEKSVKDFEDRSVLEKDTHKTYGDLTYETFAQKANAELLREASKNKEYVEMLVKRLDNIDDAVLLFSNKNVGGNAMAAMAKNSDNLRITIRKSMEAIKAAGRKTDINPETLAYYNNNANLFAVGAGTDAAGREKDAYEAGKKTGEESAKKEEGTEKEESEKKESKEKESEST